MKNTKQQFRSTRSHPMGTLSGNSEPERAFRAHNASFQTLMNRDAMITGRHTNAALGAADPDTLASTLDEMARNDKPAGISEDRTRKTHMRTDFPFVSLSRVELRSLI